MNNSIKIPKYLDDDAVCVLRAQKEESSAYQTLYSRYKHRILAYIRLRIDNKNDAREITDRTFSKAFDKIAKIKEPQFFRQWLFKIAINEIKMYHRTLATKIQATSVEDMPEQELASNPGENTLSTSVNQTLKQLTQKEQDIIIYRQYQKKDIKEIAKIMCCSEDMVSYTLKKALDKFAKLYVSKYKLGPSQKEGEKNEKV